MLGAALPPLFNVQTFLGMALAILGTALLWRLFLLFCIQVEDEQTVLVTQFGRHIETLDAPGLHIRPLVALPWVNIHRVSRQRDYRQISNIHINDATGTTVLVDLWLEFRVVDAAKAVFAVQDWPQSLQNVVSHAAIANLANREFLHILTDRTDLGEHLRRDLVDETARWGLHIENVFIRDVRLLPEVSQLMFETVAARKRQAKARIEEEGRLAVAALEARTAAQVARLVADAKAQYPLAMGDAFSVMSQRPQVFSAYNQLYELAQLRPHRTVAFLGFDALRAADAAMMSPGDAALGPSPPLAGHALPVPPAHNPDPDPGT